MTRRLTLLLSVIGWLAIFGLLLFLVLRAGRVPKAAGVEVRPAELLRLESLEVLKQRRRFTEPVGIEGVGKANPFAP